MRKTYQEFSLIFFPQTYFLFSFLLLSLLILSSCNSDSKEVNAVLQSAENVVDQYPDSALHLLDSIQNPYEWLGNSFLLNKCSDSAFYYCNRGMEIAQLHNDSTDQAVIWQNMGVAYLELGKFSQAKRVLKQALPLLLDNNRKAKVYISLAKVYAQENKKDSALYYVNLSLASSDNDNYLKATIYKLLSKIEQASGNYRKSLDYHQQYVDYLSAMYEKEKDKTILDIQKKYDFELIQNTNKELVIQRLWKEGQGFSFQNQKRRIFV